ncbi:MAG: hypothetical protein SPK28_06380, partial [Bacilli bacterium]|nr:hypothetical protein [Bacilli bacterium]
PSEWESVGNMWAMWDSSLTLGEQYKYDLMILEGNVEFNGSYFDSITSTGEQEDNKIKLKSTGKNLFNEQFEQGRWYYATGNKLTKVTSPTGFRCANPIKILPNTKYITDFKNNGTSGYFILADSQMIITRAINFGVMNNSKTIVTTNEEHYLAFYSVDESTRGYEITQIEENTIATNCEQYREKLIEIQLPFHKGLKSTLDGTIFDEINGNTGEIIQRVSDEYTALAKPIIHKINDIQLKTFDETTHITQENNILSDISFKAKVSLSSQSKRLSEENKALKEENRELREDTNTIVDSLISVFEPMLLPYDDNAEEEQKIILEKLYAIKNR